MNLAASVAENIITTLGAIDVPVHWPFRYENATIRRLYRHRYLVACCPITGVKHAQDNNLVDIHSVSTMRQYTNRKRIYSALRVDQCYPHCLKIIGGVLYGEPLIIALESVAFRKAV